MLEQDPVYQDDEIAVLNVRRRAESNSDDVATSEGYMQETDSSGSSDELFDEEQW